MRGHANRELRNLIKKSGVFTYDVAVAMGLSPSALYQRLQRELPENERQTIIDIVSDLAKRA